ncbi:MAG: toxin co-regulated pilus biosynthesis Q family protein [Alphaproteobacteria bacterium]|nr:toxin co-regulated pilus biosynthesis Q family protein [Alphaproteobacteria bacterium]
MLRKICAFMVLAGVFSVNNTMAEAILQSVTSEVFYDSDEVAKTDYAAENQMMEDQDQGFVQNYEQDEDYSEPMFKSHVEYSEREGYADGPVWPVAGSDADVEIACGETGCGNNSSTKIVTRLGSGLVIENNINTKGDGWSGGPNIMNDAPIPAGFDYECTHNAEMPLMRREMMEDDGGTVLAVSRSPRTMCNNNAGDSYDVFASRAGFTAEPKPSCNQNVNNSGTRPEIDIKVNEYVDAEPKEVAQNQVRSWVVTNGQTLRQVLQSWCDKEGWDLVWTSSREYPIEASAVFKGRFVDVASALIRNFERATPIPYAKFYKGNRVVVVSTNEE